MSGNTDQRKQRRDVTRNRQAVGKLDAIEIKQNGGRGDVIGGPDNNGEVNAIEM